MPSKIEICNLALSNLGQKSIQSLDEQSNGANYCRLFYDRCRQTLLRSTSPWRFSVTVAALALNVATPPKFYYSYAIPTDCVRILGLISPTSDTPAFERVGQNIWCDLENAQLKYVRDVTDPNEFDDGFTDCLSYYLAARLVMALTGKTELLAAMSNSYLQMLPSAQVANASERRPAGNASDTIAGSRA